MPKKSTHVLIFRSAILLVILVGLKLAVTSVVGVEQLIIILRAVGHILDQFSVIIHII